MTQLLVKSNEKILQKLENDGITPDKVIYVQTDQAGSSSAVTLNLLRDAARLQAKKAHFLDSKDIHGLRETTKQIAEGAIIYVDDFIGSGDQFMETHEFIREYITGSFSEFLVAVCICEEAHENLHYEGVELVGGIRHAKDERPLLSDCTDFPKEDRDLLRELCKQMDPVNRVGLGYNQMATMVVPYRNTPDNAPLAIRGCVGQSPYIGLLPRTTDFTKISI